MPKVKISEYSATANSNTDVASINIDEGCAPSGINNAIRAIMGHLKDFQQGTNGDPFNGPVNGTVGATTPSTGAFTTLSATGNVTLGDASTDTLNVGNGGLIKDASGNVGVGVTPSAWSTAFSQKAFQFGPVGSLMSLQASTTNNQTYVNSNAVNLSGGWTYLYSDYATQYRQYAGTHAWFNAPSGTAGNAITFTQAMTLDASGNLGVGTTAPGNKLDVRGNIGLGSGTAGTLEINGSGGTGACLLSLLGGGSGNPSWDIGTYSAPNTLTFGYTLSGSRTERARIDSSGNLLVGVTSGTSYKLALKTSAASQSAIGTTGTSGDTAFQAILITKFDNDSTTSQNFIQFQINNGGANCGKITANGANTAAFGSTSDQRVKENIAELPSQLDNIMALRPVEFDYLESYGGGHQIGFIAQEMQQIYPDVISTDDSSEKIMSITGWSKTEARLVKAIQEQQAIIQSLTARITALEGA